MKGKLIFIFILLFFIPLGYQNPKIVYGDELADNINEQIEKIDLSNLEEYYSKLNIESGVSFSELIKSVLKGEYDFSYTNIFYYLKNLFLNNVNSFIPIFISIIAIVIFSSIIINIKCNFSNDGVCNLILLICNLSIILLVSIEIRNVFQNTKNTIYNLANLSEIMSPILISLMIASGGNVSAKVYSPAVAFLSNGIINIISSIILPLIAVMIIFNFISSISTTYRLNKFLDVFTSIIKWILGVSTTIFSIFITIQGITSATFDGVSIKAAKYAISNSIPIVGGFLRDGFDIVVAGSVLIKNSIGLGVVISMFFTIFSPVIYMATFSLILKVSGAITNLISGGGVSDIFTQSSKCISYLIASVLIVGFLFFICVLLMIFSANAFL